MINLNVSVFVQIINFVFLIVVLNIVLYKPIRKVLRQRKEKVTDLEQGIELSDRSAQEKDDTYLSGIKEARARGRREKEERLQLAVEEEKVIVDRINQKAQQEMETVRTQIARDVEGVREALQNEIDAFADAIKQKILGRAV